MSNMSLCFQELTRWILLQCPHDGLIAMIHAYRSLHVYQHQMQLPMLTTKATNLLLLTYSNGILHVLIICLSMNFIKII